MCSYPQTTTVHINIISKLILSSIHHICSFLYNIIAYLFSLRLNCMDISSALELPVALCLESWNCELIVARGHHLLTFVFCLRSVFYQLENAARSCVRVIRVVSGLLVSHLTSQCLKQHVRRLVVLKLFIAMSV